MASQYKCRTCNEPINLVTFHCPCGDTAEYECPRDNLTTHGKSGQSYPCNSCGMAMKERGYVPAPSLDGKPVYYSPITAESEVCECGGRFSQHFHAGAVRGCRHCQSCKGFESIYLPPSGRCGACNKPWDDHGMVSHSCEARIA